jgi:hypothetical protein
MGLDMYLSKKTYVKQWSHDKPEEQFEVSVKRGGKPFKKIDSSRVSYVTEELMYWRKANQIHGWFVHNTQEIVEDVKYYASKEDLQNLLDICKEVLDLLNKSEMKTIQVRSGWSGGEEIYSDVEVYDCEDEVMGLLPPTEGFFYGSYDINEYYKENVEETLKFLEIELPKCDEHDDFEYYASW